MNITKEKSEAVNRKYKDSLFRQLFNEKEALLSLYNAVNRTEYTMDLPKLELEVLVLNVNYGHNKELMEQCQTLKEYSIYVARVRTYAETMTIEVAVERAVEECIKEGVLADFLRKHRSEAVRMSILEFDEEREMKLIRKAEFEDGFAEGEAIGKAQGGSERRDEIADFPDTQTTAEREKCR